MKLEENIAEQIKDLKFKFCMYLLFYFHDVFKRCESILIINRVHILKDVFLKVALKSGRHINSGDQTHNNWGRLSN